MMKFFNLLLLFFISLMSWNWYSFRCSNVCFKRFVRQLFKNLRWPSKKLLFLILSTPDFSEKIDFWFFNNSVYLIGFFFFSLFFFYSLHIILEFCELCIFNTTQKIQFFFLVFFYFFRGFWLLSIFFVFWCLIYCFLKFFFFNDYLQMLFYYQNFEQFLLIAQKIDVFMHKFYFHYNFTEKHLYVGIFLWLFNFPVFLVLFLLELLLLFYRFFNTNLLAYAERNAKKIFSRIFFFRQQRKIKKFHFFFYVPINLKNVKISFTLFKKRYFVLINNFKFIYYIFYKPEKTIFTRYLQYLNKWKFFQRRPKLVYYLSFIEYRLKKKEKSWVIPFIEKKNIVFILPFIKKEHKFTFFFKTEHSWFYYDFPLYIFLPYNWFVICQIMSFCICFYLQLTLFSSFYTFWFQEFFLIFFVTLKLLFVLPYSQYFYYYLTYQKTNIPGDQLEIINNQQLFWSFDWFLRQMQIKEFVNFNEDTDPFFFGTFDPQEYYVDDPLIQDEAEDEYISEDITEEFLENYFFTAARVDVYSDLDLQLAYLQDEYLSLQNEIDFCSSVIDKQINVEFFDAILGQYYKNPQTWYDFSPLFQVFFNMAHNCLNLVPGGSEVSGGDVWDFTVDALYKTVDISKYELFLFDPWVLQFEEKKKYLAELQAEFAAKQEKIEAIDDFIDVYINEYLDCPIEILTEYERWFLWDFFLDDLLPDALHMHFASYADDFVYAFPEDEIFDEDLCAEEFETYAQFDNEDPVRLRTHEEEGYPDELELYKAEFDFIQDNYFYFDFEDISLYYFEDFLYPDFLVYFNKMLFGILDEFTEDDFYSWFSFFSLGDLHEFPPELENFYDVPDLIWIYICDFLRISEIMFYNFNLIFSTFWFFPFLFILPVYKFIRECIIFCMWFFFFFILFPLLLLHYLSNQTWLYLYAFICIKYNLKSRQIISRTPYEQTITDLTTKDPHFMLQFWKIRNFFTIR